MKTSRRTLALVMAGSLLASAGLYCSFSGAYVRSMPDDRCTYWIGLSTTIPFAFWALVTLFVASMRREKPDHLHATTCGYAAGWMAMTAFSMWIVSFPRGPESTSTMGIAVVLTPFLFLPIFPVLFLVGYSIAHLLLLLPKHKMRTA